MDIEDCKPGMRVTYFRPSRGLNSVRSMPAIIVKTTQNRVGVRILDANGEPSEMIRYTVPDLLDRVRKVEERV